jgi:hypothetical protein
MHIGAVRFLSGGGRPRRTLNSSSLFDIETSVFFDSISEKIVARRCEKSFEAEVL